MKIELMNPKRQYSSLKEELDKGVLEVANSGNYILGDTVLTFEREIAKFVGVDFAIGVGNGTDALVIALKSLGIGLGDEVIVPAMSFFATSESVECVGAKPVFVDIDRETFTIDPNEIEKAISVNTKAIIVVHLYGYPANMTKINQIAKRHNVKVIEDAAQALGASIKEKMVGSMSDVACVSFFPTKNLGCLGDGGLILTNNVDVNRYARGFRVHGSGQDGIYIAKKLYNENLQIEKQYKKYAETKYFNSVIGYNSRLDAIQAKVLSIKLPHLDEWNQKRINIAKKYDTLIKNDFRKPVQNLDYKNIYYVYPIIYDKGRDKLIKYLNEKGIATGIYFPIPLHLLGAHNHLGYKKGDFPNAEFLAEKSLTIPMYPELTVDEINYIIETINNYEE
jgi:dTDP-4-amino-4,6-dideoxygalactose transaminase